MFGSELQQKLSGLRLRLKGYFLIHGLSKLVIGLVAVPFVIGLLDLYFHLPVLIRGLGIIGYISYLLYLLVNFLLYPLRKKISDEDLALCVERTYPELQDRLISSIQLTKRLSQDPDFPDSRQMIEKLVEQTNQQIQPLRFQKAIQGQSVLKFATLALLLFTSLVGATISYAYKRQTMFDVMVRRLLLSTKQYPQKTHIAFVRQKIAVPVGGTLELNIVGNMFPNAQLMSLTEENNYLKENHQHVQLLSTMKQTPSGVLYRQENIQNSFYLRVDDGLNVNPTLFFIFAFNPSTEQTQSQEVPLVKETIEPFNPQLFCANGENLVFEFRALGDIPSTTEIVYEFKGAGKQREVLAETGTGAYQYTKFRSVQEPFSFYVQGGDDYDNGPVYTVEPRLAPKVDALEITYHYPEYTGQKSVTKSGGKIIAPVGTWASLELVSNLELAFAEMSFGKTQRKISMTLVSTKASARFQITDDEDYFITLVGKKDQLSNTKPIKYSIQAKKDSKPLVKNIEPLGDMDCSKDASIPLKFYATDDFGLYEFLLRYKINDEKVMQTFSFGDAFFANPEFTQKIALGQEKIYATSTFEVSKLQITDPTSNQTRAIQEEDRIQFWAEAVDNRLLTDEEGKPIARPQSGDSPRILLRIVSKTEIERTLVELLLKTKKELTLVQKNQLTQIQETQKLLTHIQNKLPFEYSEEQKQEDILIHQKKITRDSKEALRDFETVLTSIIINHLNGLDETRIKEMQTHLLEAMDFSKQATEQITISRKQGESGRESSWSQSLQIEQSVASKLEVLLQMMGKWEDFNEVVQATREILEQQKKIREFTREKAK